MDLKGGYTVQPVPAPDSTIEPTSPIFTAGWFYGRIRCWYRLNCVPSFEILHLPWGSFRRFYSFKFASARYTYRSYTFISLSSVYHCYFTAFIPPRASRCNHYVINGSKFEYVIL